MSRLLTQQERLQAGAQPFSAPISIPAPVKGWNSRDEFDAMDPLDAVQLDNWFPDAGGIFVRNGSQVFATGLGTDQVATLAEYDAETNNRLLAACSGTIWDISEGGVTGSGFAIGVSAIGFGAIGAGAGSPVALANGFGSDQWQTVNFLQNLFFANGVDPMQVFNGTTLTAAAFTGLTGTPLWGCWQYQQRLFFWQKNSTGFWYALLNSINGPLAFYDLSPFTPRGGNLIAVTTSSYDGGNGVLDYIVFIMSTGDALLYVGNDPALSSNWQLLGNYRISPPVGPRGVCDYGGDSFLTTFDDHVTLQQMFTALRLGEMAPRSKVSKAVQLAVQDGINLFGWQALYYPRGRSLIFNIPNPDGTFDQHVCNTGLPTQPWCRYVNQNGCCFGLFNNLLYFGAANGTVYQADTGNLDNLGAIQATAQPAWNKLGNAQRKRIAAVRPILQSVGALAYEFEMGFDYQALTISDPVVTPSIGSPWNTSPWNISPWSSEYTVDVVWRVGGGTGTAVGVAISIAAMQPVSWFRTDLRMEGGNAL